MSRMRWTLGLVALVLGSGAAQAQQCPPPGGALNPGLIVYISSLPADTSGSNVGGNVGGAEVCIVEATPAGTEYSTFAFNIGLLPATTSGSGGFACFPFRGPARAVGMMQTDFRGTLRVRAYKDGFCADEAIVDYTAGPVMGNLLLREISAASNERVWCGSRAGLRCAGTGTPSPFRDPVPLAAPELLHQEPATSTLPGAATPGTPIPQDLLPHDALTQPMQTR